MTQEEKAKAYDEALSKCKAYIDDTEKRWSEEFSRATEEVFKEIFPELRESEDERIRKEFIKAFEAYDIESSWNLIPVKHILAWLEKQKEQKPDIELIQRSWYREGYNDREFGKEPKWVIKTGDGGPKYEENPKYGQMLEAEQKPAEWSEDIIRKAIKEVGLTQHQINWFKSNVFPPKQEWSEDDKRKLNRIYGILGMAADTHVYSTTCRLIGDKEAVELQDFLRTIAKPQEQEWNEEDNIGWDEAFACVTRAEKAAKNEEELQNAVTAEKWLKEIKFKYYVHPVKQKWSEEDKQLIGFIFDLLNDLVWRNDWAMSKEECLERLKSLRPSWRPSEWQMSMLLAVINDPNNAGAESCHLALISIYEHLKGLM